MMDFYATICRICEASDKLSEKWYNLFEKDIVLKFRTFIQIDEHDKLPKRICGACKINLENAYNFKIQCEITDSKLKYEINFLEEHKEDPQPIPEIEIDYNAVKVKNETVDAEDSEDFALFQKFNESTTQHEEIIEEDQKLPVPNRLLTLQEEENEDDEVLEAEYLNEDSEYDDISNGDESDSDDGVEVRNSKPFDRTKRVKAVPNEDKKFNCQTCGEEFQKVSDLYKHSRTVHGKNKFQCKECLRWFSRRSRLESHELLHKGVRLYECDQCPRKYATPQGLKTHMEDIHSEDYPYVCDKCGKGFSKESKLRHHYSSHIEVRNFVCEVCTKPFKTQSHLNLHMDIHKPPEQRKHKRRQKRQKTCICPYCGKVSMSIGTHSMHLRTHTGEQPYECNICSKRFTSSGSHKKHLRVHSGEKPFKCDHCGKQFRQRHHLTTHIRGVHTQEKPYKCQFCDKAFATRGNLTLHMKSHTGETVKTEPQATNEASNASSTLESPQIQEIYYTHTVI